MERTFKSPLCRNPFPQKVLPNHCRFSFIQSAVSCCASRHSGESRNPGKNWMPDQVRHDKSVRINVGLYKKKKQPEIFVPRFCERLSYSAFFQDLSGSNCFMAPTIFSVSFPKSLSNTTPSWLTINVITPVTPYEAGWATIAKPPIIFPRTT